MPLLKFEKLLREKLPTKQVDILLPFYNCYISSVDLSPTQIQALFTSFLKRVEKEIHEPYIFEPYNKRLPDYTQFALNFIRPLIDFSKSTILGLYHFDAIEKKLKDKENVIFLANHQVEPDPQAIQLLLEPSYPTLALDMVFVAGQRVITDPLAIPFSLGCNLICIFSRKYIDEDISTKQQKQLHNQLTMQKMGQLLQEGGVCIYVAPSGGRDRPDASGKVEPALFDPDSVEMFRLIAKKSGRPTHFYPLALSTYSLLPPPNSIQKELGEKRTTSKGPIHLAVGEALDFSSIQELDKIKRREAQAHLAHQAVKNLYKQITP